MTVKRAVLVGTIVGTLGLGSVASVGMAAADSGTDSNGQSLAQKIATKFNLNTAEVQAVIDKEHAAHEAQRAERVNERIQALVDNGTITKTQQAAIQAKLQAMQQARAADHDDWQSMTEQERHQEMERKRSNLEAWAKEHDLDLSTLRGILMGGHGHHGFGHGNKQHDM